MASYCVFFELLAGLIGFCDLVDDALDKDVFDMDAPGNVREELGNDVVDGGGGDADAITLSAGRKIGLLAGDVEIRDLDVNGIADEVGVVGHAASIVANGPDDLHSRVNDAPLDCGFGHAVVMRILMEEGGNEEGIEELVGHILREADADVSSKAGHAGTVRGVRVDGYAEA